MGEKVALLGFVENSYEYMKPAAVLVLLSQWEGLPTVLVEALALGTPVVSTVRPSGPAEILRGYKEQLVRVGDADALAHAILRLLEHPSCQHIDVSPYTLPHALYSGTLEVET